jgi:hypothetical protein
VRNWPARRWLAAAIAAPVVAASMAYAGWPAGPGAALIALTLGASALGGLIVASYVPVSGRGVDLGCGACAAMSGITVVAAMVIMGNYAGSLLGPVGAALVMTFGLTQRLTQPVSCATGTARSVADPTPEDELSER